MRKPPTFSDSISCGLSMQGISRSSGGHIDCVVPSCGIGCDCLCDPTRHPIPFGHFIALCREVFCRRNASRITRYRRGNRP